jgi:hypothetical protein
MLVVIGLSLVVSALVWGTYLYAFSEKQARYLWLMLPGLPLSFLINLVKRPLPGLAAEAAGIEPAFRLTSPIWFLVFVALMAPLTEEFVKVLPLLIPWVRKHVQGKASGLWVGLALGISFGLGEILYLGASMARVPAYQGLPWFQFMGFFGERLVVVGAHGLLTALTVHGMAQGLARGIGGYLSAVGLHLLVNLGALLAALRLIGPSLAQAPLLVALVLLLALFEQMRRAAIRDGQAIRTPEVLFER